MATPGPSPQQLSPQAIQQMIAIEAQKRGMTVPQFQAFQKQQIETEAAKAGMTPQQFIQMKQEEARKQFMKQQQAMQQQQQQGGQPPPGQGQPRPPQGQPQQQVQHVPVNGTVEAKPEALAVAKFLRAQNLKTRTCIFNGQRKDMFKGPPSPTPHQPLHPTNLSLTVKRAFRALQSDAYKKARSKDSLLPKVETDQEARTTLALLPISMLALRVTKKDPHEGHNHAKPKKEKRIKGLWEVKLEQQQEFDPMMHYVWLYEGSQWMTKIWAGLALVAVFTVVLFPLWPLFMRQGVWYLSVGAMGLLCAFFGLAIVRLILFCITFFAVPPGLWIFPNLFEDVGVIDSFKPLYGWQETKKKKKKAKAITTGGVAGGDEKSAPATSAATEAAPAENGKAVSSGAEVVLSASAKRHAAPTVEEAADDD